MVAAVFSGSFVNILFIFAVFSLMLVVTDLVKIVDIGKN